MGTWYTALMRNRIKIADNIQESCNVVKNRTVIVVDNEVLAADLCRKMLLPLGYNVVCAFSGEQGVELSKNNCFDIAVISSRLHDMSGIDLFTLLRQKNPVMSGILVADQTSIDMVINAMNRGFQKLLKKPLEGPSLIAAVQDTLKTVELHEENIRMNTLLPLYELGEKFMKAETEKEVYRELIAAIRQEIDLSSVSIMMFDENEEVLKIVASFGMDPEMADTVRIKPGEKIAGKVFKLEKPVILNRNDKNPDQFLNLLNRNEIAASICFPMRNMEKVIGMVNISQTRENSVFSSGDIEMLSVIVKQALMALEKIRSMQKKEETCRVTALLEQYVSPEISKILACSKEFPEDSGKVLELTVLFADIRKFTLLVQRLPPAKLRIFLNEFFELFAEIIFSCKGMLDKFMGDAALVIFGAPLEIDTPSLSAVSAAKQIMKEFEDLRRLWAEKDPVFKEIGLGIGISRGPMFLGNVGSVRRLDYTVIGTDVNVAQRLASETDSGQILLTETVFEDIKGKYTVRPGEKKLLRGMDSEITIYPLAR